MVWWTIFDENKAAIKLESKSQLNRSKYARFLEKNLIFADGSVTRMTPIMLAMGKACYTVVDIKNILEAGVNVARMKMSKFGFSDNVQILQNIKSALEILCTKHSVNYWPIAIAMELRGCITLGGMVHESCGEVIYYIEGSEVIVTNDVSKYNQCTEKLLFADYPYLHEDTKVGMEISLNHESVVFIIVEKIDKSTLRCRVIKGGRYVGFKIIAFRGAVYTVPPMRAKDRRNLMFAIQNNFDMVFLPFTRSAEDIIQIRQVLDEYNKSEILVIACICNMQGYENIDEIIEVSDGVQFYKHFFTYEVLIDRTCMIQKAINAKCYQKLKPFFTSGSAVRSNSTIEDRSREGRTIANSLLDGADGFLIRYDYEIEFKHIDQVVRATTEVCKYIEPIVNHTANFWSLFDQIPMPLNAAEACAMSCNLVARVARADAIILQTKTGATARMVAALRPPCVVVAITRDEGVARKLNLYRGVLPYYYTETPSSRFHKEMENQIDAVLEFAVTKRVLQFGQKYVALFRSQCHSAFCDAIQIRQITTHLHQLTECPE